MHYNVMDDNSPLYLAHQNGRYADKYLKKKDFDKAIDYHQKAIEYLQEAMTLTKFPKNLESLQLQLDYHLAQTNVIRAQKTQLNLKLQKAEAQKKRKMNKRKSSELEQKDQELGNAIKGAVEETSTLLGLLALKKESGYSEELLSGYLKHPKDEKTVVEELKTLNGQLKELVSEVLTQLESSRKENEALRHRLAQYEKTPAPAQHKTIGSIPAYDLN